MEIHYFSEKNQIENTVLCLGDFDGMHLGHRRIFELAKDGGSWGVLLFSHNSKGEPSIMTCPEKLEFLGKFGASYAIVADFEGEIKNKTPEEFVDFLEEIGICAVAVGYDYRFGCGAVGDTKLLKKLCSEKNIDVFVADAVLDGGIPVKSSLIRNMIKNGDTKNTLRLLGGSYVVSGKVLKGFQNGRKMDYPTANIEITGEKLLFPNGVYKGVTNGIPSAINIGTNPTVEGRKKTVEVHIIGFYGDLYGKNITCEITEKIRDEIKFTGLADLKNQIKKDIEYIMGG